MGVSFIVVEMTGGNRNFRRGVVGASKLLAEDHDRCIEIEEGRDNLAALLYYYSCVLTRQQE